MTDAANRTLSEHLRAVADFYEYGPASKGHTTQVRLIREAADEIERLRTKVTAVENVLARWTSETGDQALHALYDDVYGALNE